MNQQNLGALFLKKIKFLCAARSVCRFYKYFRFAFQTDSYYFRLFLMLIKSRAIVLRVRKYSDEGQIVDIFTEDEGRLSFFVRVSRSRRAAVRHTLFQPLALLRMEWNHRAGAQLQHPKSVQSDVPFSSLPYDSHKSAIGLFIAEFLGYAVHEEPDPHILYMYIANSVEWLDTCPAGFSNFHLVFLLQLTRFLGFYPNADRLPEGALYFDMLNSCFSAVRPTHSHFLYPEDARWLPLLMRFRYETMHLLRLTGEMRSRLLGFINEYYSLHVPNFPQLKSLPVLQSLFSY